MTARDGKPRAVCLLSGGLDSTTSTAIAKSQGYEIYCLSFDYGQRHRRELDAAARVAAALEAMRHIVVAFDLRQWGGSALTDDIAVPTGRSEGEMTESIPVTYVPARNTIFLSFALGWAETLGARCVFIGVNQLDYSGYPDCREEFLRSFEQTARLATKAGVEGIPFRVEAPLLSMTKAEIIGAGTALGVDYGLTWSCYQGGEVPCGGCDSCLLRAKGFAEAGLRDPLMQKR